jgi:hypothetical protein
VGFDYRADDAKGAHEMGEEAALADAPRLRVKQPTLERLDPKRTPPKLTTRILRAKEGGWDEVATGAGDLDYVPTAPGAYRAEIRIVPHHLREDLGDEADDLLELRDWVWIYSNPIYIR